MVDKARELDKKATQLRRGRGGWMYWASVGVAELQQPEGRIRGLGLVVPVRGTVE